MRDRFLFGRLPIEGEKLYTDLESKAKEPMKLDSGTDDTIIDVDLTAPRNFRVANERLVTQPDGTTMVELLLEWDDQSGAQDYEVWISEEQ